MDNSTFIITAISSIFSFFITYIIVLMFVSIWYTFNKAGKPGWASIIPIYNLIIWLKIADKPTWWIFLLFIPLVNIVISIIVNKIIGEKFGKSKVFGALGLSFLPFIFYPILASPKTKYFDMAIQEKEPSRVNKLGILLSSLLIYSFIFYPIDIIFSSITRLTQGSQDLAFWSIQVIYILAFFCAICIWKYKKWSVYVFISLHILIFTINFINGIPLVFYVNVFLAPFFLILFIRPVWSTFDQTKKMKTSKFRKKKYICIRCKNVLYTKRYSPGGLLFGSEDYEKWSANIDSNLSRVAYKCRNCGALQCRKCAEKYACPKCGNRIFDVFITSDR